MNILKCKTLYIFFFYMISIVSFTALNAQEQLKILPKNVYVRNTCTKIFEDLNPSIIIEKQEIIKKPANFKQEEWTKEEKLKILTAASSISSLSGLQYYSASRKAMRTLYTESFVIRDLKTMAKTTDPSFDSAKDNEKDFTLYAKQTDLTFGENIYKYEYNIKNNVIFFIQQNVTPLSYGIIPLLKKERLNSVVALIDDKDSIVIYIAIMAKASMPKSMIKSVNASFTTRAEAIIDWFKNKDLNM
ncbi:MAG: hypothetical protein Ta2F_17160 [Termitinemataceae bacterium]|nr:MAG: hypothetical protein Ta2F_17160 [Termitinemataceae bacterium]